MDYSKIIERYYRKNAGLFKILVNHSADVTRKALDIAERHPELNLDRRFVEEAAMVHDIGIFKTHAPSIRCFGREPYLRHGVIGAELMRQEGYPAHARVCERHTGTGLTKEEIVAQQLPLPHVDLIPESMEEQVICFADCFFSKTKLGSEKSVEDIHRKVQKFGVRSLKQFDDWCAMFL
ncbi:MAG: HDIG domain-containing protein [Acidobacteriota bacterium]|jgi:uncharacterized protein|nr:HDIG domain-containing protein [Acidobacteriota bacterium]